MRELCARNLRAVIANMIKNNGIEIKIFSNLCKEGKKTKGGKNESKWNLLLLYFNRYDNWCTDCLGTQSGYRPRRRWETFY